MSKAAPTLNERVRSRLTHLAYLPSTLLLVWDATRRGVILWVLLLVVQGIQPALVVYVTRPLVDAVAAIVGTSLSWDALGPFLTLAAMMGGLLVLGEMVNHALLGVRASQARILQDYVSGLIHAKAVEVDLAFYENADFYDHLQRAREQAGHNLLALLDHAGNLLRSSVALLGIAIILFPYGWWLPVVLVFASLPALLTIIRHQWRIQQWWRSTTADRRWASYYDWILTAGSAAPELRLFGWGTRFRETFQGIRKRLRDGEMSLIKRELLARITAGIVGLLVFGGVLGWVVWRAVQGQASLGDLALFYQAFSQGQRLMMGTLDSTGQIFSKMLYLSSLFEFLALRPQIVDSESLLERPPIHSSQPEPSILFDDVTFRYPNSEQLALNKFSLFIPAGQTVAIVGSNGAGKSTFVKLLCRFYDPEEGSVQIGGIDLRDFRLSDLRRMITVLFQTPVPYHASVADNIAISDFQAKATMEDIEAAARAAGAHEIIKGLPLGYETLLGKQFANGTELSGGEQQRIALARAFLRRSSIVVLDEPTSFMDSWAEADWLDRFRSLVAGRTAILITHRFTTAMRADRICVVDRGRITEAGSHDELMALGGRYARSWTTQMTASIKETANGHHI